MYMARLLEALLRKHSLGPLVWRFCVSRKGRKRGGGWGHPQGAVHMAAARLDSKRAMISPPTSLVGTKLAISHCCIETLLSPFGVHFWQGRHMDSDQAYVDQEC